MILQRSRLPLRLRILLGGLLVTAAALPLSIYLRNRQPAPPPANADLPAQIHYWKQRAQDDSTDVRAFVRTGSLEEQAGYYMSAVKYLYAARALGAPDTEISAPLGRALTHLAQDDKALPEMEKALRLSPNSVEAAANLAGLYVNQDQTAVADAVLRKFVAANATLDPPNLRRLGFCFLECDDNRQALRMAAAALAANPSDLVSRSIAARCALALGDLAAARTHIENILQQVPKDAGTRYLYGVVLSGLGDHDRALLEWERAIALNPRAPDIYERIGDAYMQRGDYPHAALAFENLARLAPTAINASRAAIALSRARQTDRAAYWAAVTAGYHGDLATALREAGIAVASHDPQTHRLGLQALAETYRGMHDRAHYLQTMHTLTAAGTVDDLLLMAQAYAELDDHAQRISCLQQALKIARPDQRAAIEYDMAVVYRTRGMYDDAERVIAQAVADDPRNPDLYRQQAEINYSRRSLPGRLDRAIASWQQAIALDGEDASDWQHLGVALDDAGQPQNALPCLEHAADLEPGSGPAYQELSRVYSRLGDPDTSRHMMDLYAKYVAFEQNRQTLRTRARREHATFGDLTAYGNLLVKIDDPAEAITQYERALSLRPGDAPLRRKLEDLYAELRMTDQLAQIETRRHGKGAQQP